MILSSATFSLVNLCKIPSDCILGFYKGTNFYSTLNQPSHVPLLRILCLIMRFPQGSGLFWAPRFITPASCRILSVPKREMPIESLSHRDSWQVNVVNICNILIARVGPWQCHYDRHYLLIVVQSFFCILEGEFQDPRRWYQSPQILKPLIWNVPVFLYNLYTSSCIVKSCPYDLEYLIQCKQEVTVTTT